MKSTVRIEALWSGRREGIEEGRSEDDLAYGKVAIEGTIRFKEKAIEWKVVDEVDAETEEWRVEGGYYE
jgi:hypothetical protein